MVTNLCNILQRIKEGIGRTCDIQKTVEKNIFIFLKSYDILLDI